MNGAIIEKFSLSIPCSLSMVEVMPSLRGFFESTLFFARSSSINYDICRFCAHVTRCAKVDRRYVADRAIGRYHYRKYRSHDDYEKYSKVVEPNKYDGKWHPSNTRERQKPDGKRAHRLAKPAELDHCKPYCHADTKRERKAGGEPS